MWDLIVSVPDHCLSFYFIKITEAGTIDTLVAIYIYSVECD